MRAGRLGQVTDRVGEIRERIGLVVRPGPRTNLVRQLSRDVVWLLGEVERLRAELLAAREGGSN